MHKIYRNVNYAYHNILMDMANNRLATVVRDSRNGSVQRIVGPFILTYTHPTERVLVNKFRDCNPFFHIFESLWMLDGRNDVESLSYYNKRMSTYSDDGKTLHGAYGYRWRKFFGIDQIEAVIQELTSDPASRRAVIQMWDASDSKVARSGGLDVPCNTQAVFEIDEDRLNMSVFNRSNDLIWGMLGANVVHFSFLQEYIALSLGLPCGVYNQISNNTHVYSDIWSKYKATTEIESRHLLNLTKDEALIQSSEAVPIFGTGGKAEFDVEVGALLRNPDAHCRNRFLKDTVSPMLLAFRHHKERDYARAIEAVGRVEDDAWRYVSTNWIKKRKYNYENKQ